MFKNIYPLFEKKRLLNIEMLENLRDYPRTVFGLLLQDYSDGVLSGCRTAAGRGGLTVQTGILYYKGTPYLLTEGLNLACKASGKLTYLKVRFLDKTSGTGQEEYLSSVYLDETAPDGSCELELARFKLQPGARLRNDYTDFFDYNTEFDTLNLIHVPYAALDRSSISPQILKAFARALLSCGMKRPWDYPFCMNCLQLQTAMPYEEIRWYLNLRLEEEREDYGNAEIYQSLKRILLETDGKEPGMELTGKEPKKLLLI